LSYSWQTPTQRHCQPVIHRLQRGPQPRNKTNTISRQKHKSLIQLNFFICNAYIDTCK
jgi:hypothetical protein